MVKQASDIRVLIVGGGITGLSAAVSLKDAGIRTSVFERENTVGGRMSTVRFAGGVFDDGAQFFTVRDQRFDPLVREWLDAGILTDWFHSHLIKGGESNPDGYPRYCGKEGMRSILQYMVHAHSLEVLTGKHAESIKRAKDGYELTFSDGTTEEGDAVILAVPAPSAASLVENSGLSLFEEDQEALSEVCYIPSIVVMAVMDNPSALTEWGGLRIEGEYIDWIADNYRKGISPDVPAVTIQSTERFSGLYWDESDEEIAGRLIDNAKILLRCDPVEVRLRRWELGKPVETHPREWITAGDDKKVLLAGDGFRGYRVEGAAVSGIEAARELVRLLK